MNPAKIKNITVKVIVEVDGKELEFRATGQRVIFPGYFAAVGIKLTEVTLPEFKEGDVLNLNRLFATQHFTQPPGRYSEATLIKELEKHGIGRPSTYAPTISTIVARKYVEKEGKYFIPTDTGMVVTRLLREHFPNIVDLEFTAEMEEDLDRIAEGKEDNVKFLRDFFKPFQEKLEKKEEEISRDEFTVLGEAPDDIKCPECGSSMVIKLSKYGKFYSCSKFPDCKGMRNMEGETEEDIQKKAKSPEFLEKYKPAPKTDDGRDYVLKEGRYGEFWAHPDYPKVKDAKPLEMRPEKIKEMYGAPPTTDDGREFKFKSGKYGPYWSHPDYPKVKKTKKAKKVSDKK
jgi:DNA topoisomerase-1